MSKPRVVLNAPLPEAARSRADSLFDLVAVTDVVDPSTRIGDPSGIRAILTSPGRGANNALIKLLPDLKAIVLTGAGMDLVDHELAQKRGIAIHPTGSLLAEDVADTALLLMLASVRNLMAADRHVRSGDWAVKGPLPLTRSANGRRVGILGFGSIGQALARRLDAMKSEVRYFSRRPVEGWEAQHVADLLVLADWAEILVVAVPGGPATERIVSARVLEALGPSGMLINVARGSVVDEEALIAALSSGQIAAAGLDVFENEPSPDPRFRTLPNTVLMSHCGSASIDAREAAADEAVRRVAEIVAA